MLKTTKSSDKPVSSRNDSNKLTFGKNNNSKLVFRKNNSNSKVNEYGIGENGVEYAKKSGKLFKSRKSKGKKILKS